MRGSRSLVLLAFLFALGEAHAAPGQHTRELRRRTLKLDDASVTTLPELHVAGGTATVLTFSIPLQEGGAIPGAVKELFYPLAQTGDRTVIVVPKKDLVSPVPLSVSLQDGTVITFKCLSAPRDADAQVDVILALRARAPEQSASSLKLLVGQLRGQLDDCKATSGEAGAHKLAELLLAQSLDTPQAFERHPLRFTQKDNRLLVEARWAYRLLGLTYVVLTVENRDPDRVWVLDRADVKVTGGGEAADIRVKSIASELPSLAPEVSERVIVAFPTPSTSGKQKVTLMLFEKDGPRTVSLSGLEL
jgi:uncharacterized protein (TIGR02268 family)